MSCPCRKPIQTVEHILTQCILFMALHLPFDGRPQSLPQLIANLKRAEELLQFPKDIGDRNKPRAVCELQASWMRPSV
jgi:hypothetical protein